MNRTIAASVAFFLSAVPLLASDHPVVVELFTSQGCSSCPPADEMLHALAERDDVIALALHVDYWDYIGWKDEFAHPRNATRQRGYAATAGRRTIYTPELIVNGQTDIVGAKPMAVSKAIAQHKESAEKVELTLERVGDELRISAKPLAQIAKPLVLQMLRYQPERTSNITRGENSGKTIQYANVTEDWQTLQEWDGQSPLSLTVQVKGDTPLVVLVQSAGYGPIIAASVLK